MHVGARENRAAGAIVIVFGGNKGAGFSVQADLATTMQLPELLEYMAREIRQSLAEGEA